MTTTCPHCGHKGEHPCYERPSGDRVYECVRCGREWEERKR